MRESENVKGPPVRLTEATKEILRTMIRHQSDDPPAEMFGLEVVRLTGLGAGTVYPILRRLERAGWLEARLEQREEEAPSDARPPRVYYRIDPKSLRGVQSRVAEHDAKRRATDSSVRGLKPVEGTW